MIKKSEPLVSVVIPTYNRASLLIKSIQSVLNQTYNDFEVIIIDDGSDDNTEELVESFHDERIRYIRHEVNMGVACARNTGINASSGVFIAFQDSDDEWLPRKLEKEINIFNSCDSKVGVVYSGLWRFNKNKKTYFPLHFDNKIEGRIHEELIKGNFVHGLSIIRRSCFEKIGLFDEELPALEDWEIYLRLSKYYDFKFINEPLIISYLNKKGLTLNLAIQIDATEQIIRKHHNEFNEQKKATANIYGYLASQLCMNGLLMDGRFYFLKAIKMYPINIQYYCAFLISFLGSKSYKKFLEISRFLELFK